MPIKTRTIPALQTQRGIGLEPRLAWPSPELAPRIYPTETGVTTWSAGISPTWSAWTQLAAATPGPGLITKMRWADDVSANTMNGTWAQFQLGVGASGGEKIISSLPSGPISHSTVSNRSNTHGTHTMGTLPFPIYIPGGSRISARATGDHASVGGDCRLHFQWVPMPTAGDEYGPAAVPWVANPTAVLDTGITRTNVGYSGSDPYAVYQSVSISIADTMSSWVTLIAGLPLDAYVTHVWGGTGRGAQAYTTTQLGVGPAGRERVIQSEQTWDANDPFPGNTTASQSGLLRHLVIPQFIKAGTRVAARGASNDTVNNDHYVRAFYIPARDVVPITDVKNY